MRRDTRTVLEAPSTPSGSRRTGSVASGANQVLKLPLFQNVDQSTAGGARAIADQLSLYARQYRERAEMGTGFSSGSAFSTSAVSPQQEAQDDDDEEMPDVPKTPKTPKGKGKGRK